MRSKFIMAAALVAAASVTSACGPRQVEVQTGAQTVTEVSLSVTNALDEAVNVYVVSRGQQVFLKQVAGKSTLSMHVPGIAAGTTVKLKATKVSGGESYERDNVQLNGGVYEWRVP